MSLSGLALAMLVAGLTSSFHCVGMCGPLVLGFARAGGTPFPGAAHLARESAPYHAGRIWTYALLGLLAGAAGQGLQRNAVLLGIERPIAIVLGLLVSLAGVALLVGGRSAVKPAGACARGIQQAASLVRRLAGGPGVLTRFLLGVVMGLLPCGLVYAMLAVALSLGSPVGGAVAMAAFGLGTVPALVAVLALARLLPASLRAGGGRIAAASLVIAGTWMVVRATALVPSEEAGCSVCAEGGDTARGER